MMNYSKTEDVKCQVDHVSLDCCLQRSSGWCYTSITLISQNKHLIFGWLSASVQTKRTIILHKHDN